MKIVLSDAHCSTDQGAAAHGWTEYKYSCLVNEIIKKYIMDFGQHFNPVVSIVDGGRYSAPAEVRTTTEIVNGIEPDAVIENHLNGSEHQEANGSAVLYYPGSEFGEALANAINDRWQYLPFKERGLKPRGDIYLLRKTKCPAIITEPLFVTNKQEAGYLDFPRGIEVMGNLIGEAILQWWGAL